MTRLERAVVSSAAGLSAAQRRRDDAVVALLAAGASLRQVAQLAGISHTAVQRIQRKRGERHGEEV